MLGKILQKAMFSYLEGSNSSNYLFLRIHISKLKKKTLKANFLQPKEKQKILLV